MKMARPRDLFTITLVVCNRIVRAMKPPEYNASYLALVHKSFQGDIQLSGPLTLMSCTLKTEKKEQGNVSI